jgi:hypothetical protein
MEIRENGRQKNLQPTIQRKWNTPLTTIPAGSKPPPANPPIRSSGSSQNDPFAQSNTGKAQSIWATHVIIF